MLPRTSTCCAERSRRTSRGFTLLEVLIASVIFTLASVPLVLLFSSTSRQVKGLDRRAEIRALTMQILGRVEAMDFVTLHDHFGIEPESPGRLVGKLVEGARNPLMLDRTWIDRLAELGLGAELEFRFMTRSELGMDPTNPLKSTSGLLHLQAGTVALRVSGPGYDETLRKSVYCPMILGRPGLLLNQCPAVNKALRDGKYKDFP
jgi:prepilin-type N-terminal cleavage/methylation domain-containing protein